MATQQVPEAARPANADGVVFRKVWLFGAIAVVASVVVNLVLFAIFPPPAVFPADAIALFTAIGAIGALLVFAALVRFSRRPIRLFQIVSLVVFIVTLLPNILLALNPPDPRYPASLYLWLILFHIAPAAFTVWLLSTRTRA